VDVTIPSSRVDVVAAGRPLPPAGVPEPHLEVSSVVDQRHSVTRLAVTAVRHVHVRLAIGDVGEVHPQSHSIACIYEQTHYYTASVKIKSKLNHPP